MKENFYLLDYLKKNDSYDKEIIDIFKNKFDEKIYSYGEQFQCPSETGKKKNICLAFFVRGLKILKQKKTFSKQVGKRIVSTAYFFLDDELRNIGYNVMAAPWGNSKSLFFLPSYKLLKCYYKLSKYIEDSSYSYMLSEEFATLYYHFKNLYKENLQKLNIVAICLPSDMNIWDRISIKIAKELNIPTFLFSHGLPGRYNALDESRTDYLVVWGERIKQNYIKFGHKENKIFISGHPMYKELDSVSLRNSMDNILVLTHSMGQSQTESDVILSDRGNCVLYLYMVENVLKKIGIKKAFFRPHPSENGLWYKKFIDNSFYVIDTESLINSLQKKTLIIGPTSTVFLESFFYNINYIIFEPSINDIDILNYPLVPPFDGSEKNVLVAKTENELLRLLETNALQPKEFIREYIAYTFSLEFIRNLI